MDASRIRLATADDAKQVAQIYKHLSEEIKDGFMHKLGKRFLSAYHRVLFSEKECIAVCLEIQGKVVGFVSGSLNARAHMAALRRHRVQLLIAALPALIRNPRLFAAMRSRANSPSAGEETGGYVAYSGNRLEFWGCLPEARLGGAAIRLLRTWISIARLLGAQDIWFEVDKSNQHVIRAHKAMGATIRKEIVTPDGRTRLLMSYAANNFERPI